MRADSVCNHRIKSLVYQFYYSFKETYQIWRFNKRSDQAMPGVEYLHIDFVLSIKLKLSTEREPVTIFIFPFCSNLFGKKMENVMLAPFFVQTPFDFSEHIPAAWYGFNALGSYN